MSAWTFQYLTMPMNWHYLVSVGFWLKNFKEFSQIFSKITEQQWHFGKTKILKFRSSPACLPACSWKAEKSYLSLVPVVWSMFWRQVCPRIVGKKLNMYVPIWSARKWICVIDDGMCVSPVVIKEKQIFYL